MKSNQSKTNGNRDRCKHVPQRYVDTGNTNPVPNHLETPLIDREPMEIEIAEKVGIQTEYVDAGNTNPVPNHLETRSVDQ